MNPSNALAQVAARQPGAPAILWPDGMLDYAGFEDVVAFMAGALDLPKGARVALVMENGPAFLPALFAIWRAGLVAVPVNARLHAREHAWIVGNAGASLCFASPGLARALAGVSPCRIVEIAGLADLPRGAPVARADTGAGDAAWLFYTSGTTGRPKGAVITHRNLMAASWAYFADVDQVGPEDIRLHMAPMTHGSGLYAVPFVIAGAQNLIPGRFDMDGVFDVLAEHRHVSFFCAPTMVTRLCAHPRAEGAHPGLKTLEYGGAPMYRADLDRALQVFGPRLYHLYGQGESPMTITHVTKAMHADPAFADRLDTVGVARTGSEVAILDDAGRHLPPGDVGEVATRGDVVFAGYWQNPAATAAALQDGWLRTGDVGRMDAQGFVTLMDRSKDMVISGGMNIYPREIEEVLLTHPDVAECAVIGRPDPDWGEALVAFVVGRDGTPDLEALEAHCLDNLARFKRPRDWRVVESLPKNAYGKIPKTDLRAILANESGVGG